MKVAILAAFLLVQTGISAQTIATDGSQSQELVHLLKASLSSLISLDCRAGADKDQYELTISGVETSSANSFLQRLDKDGNPILNANGFPEASSLNTAAGELRLTGPLTDLDLEKANKECDGTAAEECGSLRRGHFKLRKLILVGGSVSALYRPFVHTIEVECRLVPSEPNGPLQLILEDAGIDLGNCTQFNHEITISRLDDSFRYSVDLRRNAPRFKLFSCAIRTVNGDRIEILSNGQIINGPLVRVQGAVEGKEHTLDISGLNAPGSIDCEITYCSSSPASGLPACHSGQIEHVAASRSAFNAQRAVAEHAVSNVRPDLQPGTLVQVLVGAASRSTSDHVRCPNQQL